MFLFVNDRSLQFKLGFYINISIKMDMNDIVTNKHKFLNCKKKLYI